MLFSADLLRDTALAAPLVLCGDFKMWSPLPGPILRLLRTGLRDAAVVSRSRRATYPRRYRSSGSTASRGRRRRRPRLWGGQRSRTRAASDHLPLWVDLEPRGSAQPLAVGKAGA